MAQPVLDHKRGASFRFVAYYEDPNGVPLSIVGLMITSSVRTYKGDFSDNLSVEFTDAPNGEFTITEHDTSNWPLGRKLIWDIRIVDGLTIVLTDTVNLNVLQQATTT